MKYNPLKIGALTAQIPIIQGGMGVGISLGNLAGAVAAAGGVGMISTAQIGFREPDFEQNPKECNLRAIRAEFEKARRLAPKGIIGFNIMVALRFYEEYVRAAVAAGADIIISGAGLPTELPGLVKGSETKIAPIVSTEKSANVILKYWNRKYGRTADMLVIEGPMAGGHLGFNQEQLAHYTKENYIAEIKKIQAVAANYAAKYGVEIPVVVAGGIDTAQAMEEVMALDVQGVQVASRFVTTEECDADIRYKMSYVDARREDICIVKSPVGMPGRAICNSFMERVMAGERFSPKKCLMCLQHCDPAKIPYCITERLINAAKGDVENALLFCGANAYKAEKIETVKDVFASLLGEK